MLLPVAWWTKLSLWVSLSIPLWLCAVAAGAAPRVRTSTTPTLGAGVTVHPRVGLRGHVQGRFLLAGPAASAHPDDRSGVEASVGVQVRAHRIVAVGVDYSYGYGHFPVEAPGDREHRATPSIRLASNGDRFVISNVTRLDLRALRTPGPGWGFYLRPRDAVRVTAIARPWLRTSLEAEALLQPAVGLTEMFQFRSTFALHGVIGPESAKANLFWLTGVQLALSPAALATGASTDAGRTLDLVLGVGLAGLF